MKWKSLIVILPYFVLFMVIIGIACNDDDDDDDNGGAVYTDSSNGLTWQLEPTEEPLSWFDAGDYCAELIYDGHDDWRLPTISELRGLVRGCPNTETGGDCAVTDSCLSKDECWDLPCTGCPISEGPAGGCYWPEIFGSECHYYWSSSPVEENEDKIWHVDMCSGYVSYCDRDRDSDPHVICVR